MTIEGSGAGGAGEGQVIGGLIFSFYNHHMTVYLFCLDSSGFSMISELSFFYAHGEPVPFTKLFHAFFPPFCLQDSAVSSHPPGSFLRNKWSAKVRNHR